jgi:hypothetical protein
MSEIYFSKDYVNVMDRFVKILDGLKANGQNTSHAMIFRSGEEYYLSKMGLDTLACVKATADHVKFESEELMFTNLRNFMDYLGYVEYPENEKSKVQTTMCTTRDGAIIPTFSLKGNRVKYFVPCAAPVVFETEFDKMIPSPKTFSDFPLVAEFVMDKDVVKLITDNMGMLGVNGKSGSLFGLKIDGGIELAIRGGNSQSFFYEFDTTKVRINGGYKSISTETQKIGSKLFSTTVFKTMQQFPVEWYIQLRYIEEDDRLTFKAFSDMVPGIEIIVGTTENNKTQEIEGDYDVVTELVEVET